MEKLIELLNEWERERVNHNTKEFIPYDRNSELLAELIISKKFGFIKWLVENDKIDFNKDAFISLASELGCTAYDEKIVLMVLSISDTPIEDLISYLHE